MSNRYRSVLIQLLGYLGAIITLLPGVGAGEIAGAMKNETMGTDGRLDLVLGLFFARSFTRPYETKALSASKEPTIKHSSFF